MTEKLIFALKEKSLSLQFISFLSFYVRRKAFVKGCFNPRQCFVTLERVIHNVKGYFNSRWHLEDYQHAVFSKTN